MSQCQKILMLECIVNFIQTKKFKFWSTIQRKNFIQLFIMYVFSNSYSNEKIRQKKSRKIPNIFIIWNLPERAEFLRDFLLLFFTLFLLHTLYLTKLYLNILQRDGEPQYYTSQRSSKRRHIYDEDFDVALTSSKRISLATRWYSF